MDFRHILAILIASILILLIIAATFILIIKEHKERNEKIAQLERYTEISIGMPEEKMLSIMGEGYTKSCINAHKNKYVWRIDAKSYDSMTGRVYEPAKKVIIHTNNNFVVSINPYNV